MQELKRSRPARVALLCRERGYETNWIEDALERTDTRFFVERAADPGSVLVCPHHGVCFAAGEPCGGGVGTLFRQLGAVSDAPLIRYVSVPAVSWIEKTPCGLQQRISVKKRVVYRFEPSRWSGCEDWSRPTDGRRVARLDRYLIRQVDAELDPYFRWFWDSPAEFLRDGVGFALLVGERVVSVAYSVFPVRGSVEIAVATRRTFRGRGYALAAAAYLVDDCLRGKRIPCWSTDAANEPACRLAECLGFVRAAALHWVKPLS